MIRCLTTFVSTSTFPVEKHKKYLFVTGNHYDVIHHQVDSSDDVCMCVYVCVCAPVLIDIHAVNYIVWLWFIQLLFTSKPFEKPKLWRSPSDIPSIIFCLLTRHLTFNRIQQMHSNHDFMSCKHHNTVHKIKSWLCTSFSVNYTFAIITPEIQRDKTLTPLETNISPEKWWLEDRNFPYQHCPLSVDIPWFSGGGHFSTTSELIRIETLPNKSTTSLGEKTIGYCWWKKFD